LPHSSPPSAVPLHLVLEPSRALAAALVAVHFLAAAAALANPLPLWFRLALCGGVLLSCYLTLREYVLDPKVRGLSLGADGRWEIIFRHGVAAVDPSAGTVVTRWLVVLHLASESAAFAIPILRDSVDPESFRRLRVHLRIQGGKAGPAGS
jgi:hypothetical protein